MSVLRALVVLGLLGVVACSDKPAPPRAAHGEVDLRSWQFDDSQVLLLQGDWSIYWNRLIEPGDAATPDGALSIGMWHGHQLDDGRELGSDGSATYRLR